MKEEPGRRTGSAIAVWDKEASSYDTLRKADAVYCSCIKLAARGVPAEGAVSLDAGCGTGLSTIALKDRCETLVAVDYSLESLKALKSKNVPNVMPVQADLTSLPFKKSAFDSCLCSNALQHLRPDGPQQRAAEELGRVTKEGGVLSVSVHHYSRTKQKACWIKEGKPGQPGIDYIFRFSRRDLLTLFPSSRITGVGYYGWLRVPFFGSRLQNFLGIMVGKIAALLGYGHMLIALTKKSGTDITVN